MAFKTARSVALAALLAFSPIALAGDPGCESPGDHMCAILFISSVFAFPSGPDGPGPSGNSYADVINGNCDTIVTSGGLEPQSPGFAGDFQTAYGITVHAEADFLGTDQIEGASYSVDGVQGDTSGCVQRNTGFDPASTVLQCNFAC